MPSSSLYRSIHDLPLARFEDCMVMGNLSALVISGFPNPIELATAWNEIMSEYSACIGGADYKMYFNLKKEVELLRITIQQINFLIETMRNTRIVLAGTEELRYMASELNGFLATSFKFDPTNEKEFNKMLERCKNRSKINKINLDLKEQELTTIELKFGGSSVKQDRQYFTSVLITMSKHFGYRLTKEITVSEYCEYVKQYNKHCDLQLKNSK